MRSLPAWVSLALLTAVLPAQEPAPTAASTTASILRIDTVGPAGWRQAFLPTNLGALLSSAEGEQLWRPHVKRLEELVSGMAGAEHYGEARKRLLAYGGSIRAQLWLESQGFARDPKAIMGIWAAPDGDTDLAALASDLRRGLSKMMGEPAKETVAGRQLESWAWPGSWMLVPEVQGKDLRIILGDIEDKAAALGLCATAPATAARTPAAPVLAIDFDIATLRKLMADDDAEENAILRGLGVDSLGTLRTQIGTAGPHLLLELSLAFTDAPRGLFAGFFPERPGVPPLRHLLPAGMEQWRVGRFDSKAFYEACEILAAAFGSDDPAELRKQATAELGFNPVDELIALSTDEVLMFGDMPLLQDVDERGIDWGFALRLQDGAAFRERWFKLLGTGGMMQTHEKYEHEGVPVRRYGGMFGPAFHTAVSNRLMILAFGPEARDRIGQMLDADKPDAEQPATASLLRQVARHAPPGHNGEAVLDLDTLLTRQVATFLDVLGSSVLSPLFNEVGVEPESVQDGIDGFMPLLRQHGLARTCSMTGCADGRWVFRAFW